MHLGKSLGGRFVADAGATEVLKLGSQLAAKAAGLHEEDRPGWVDEELC